MGMLTSCRPTNMTRGPSCVTSAEREMVFGTAGAARPDPRDKREDDGRWVPKAEMRHAR